MCHALEITSAHQVTAIERRHGARFRAVFDQSAVPQFLCDLEGIVTEVNEAFSALLGTRREQLLGRPVRDLIHCSDGGRVNHALASLLQGTSESTQVPSVLRDRQDRPIPGLASAQVLREENGTVVGVSVVLNDLSELQAAEGRHRQQEQFFATMSQRASDVAIVADATGLMLYTSPGITKVLGYTPEDILDSEGWDFIHPDDVPAMRIQFARVAEGGETETATLRVRNASGEWRWMEETMHNCLGTPVQGIVCNLRDITERVAAEADLKASMLLYRTIAETVDEGLLLSTQDGTTVYVNERLGEILGLATDAIYAQRLDTILDDQHLQLKRDRTADGAGRGPQRFELSYDHPNGEQRTLQVVAAPIDLFADGRGGSLATVSDITRTRQLENELRRAALYDGLAGLPNRTLLMDRLKHALARESTGTAVLFVDLDHFKLVNDTRGHAVGDDVLVQVAARLSTSVRPQDTVARLGGDEFVVVCEDVDADAAASVSQDLIAVLNKPFSLATGPLQITASIGVAMSPPRSAEILVRNADTAMYAAKVAGRGRVQHFDSRLAAHTAERRELSVALDLALAKDELTMHYQPVIELDSGRVVGMEALARWERDGGVQVPPDRFVVIAEETGLAHRLDRWALRNALTGVSRLRAEHAVHPDSFVAVNLSARNLSNPELETDLLKWTEKANLSPCHVLLEITESAIMSDAAAAVSLLQRLRHVGFLIAVDDFGTGHSSLAYLRNLPLTTLKIDRSFVASIGENRNALAITRSIVDLATAMGFSVIAEGVETAQHAEMLRELGCHWAQGWLWSPAVSVSELRSAHTMVRRYDTSCADLFPLGQARQEALDGP
ncbi:sensor domain-containing protein [Nocardioides bigeumensis]|uniref:sensor domain-containing protein n=1 Tax=Nocardioides bigeumensis TaxID=433657 RepID=UPI0031D91FB4